MVAGGRSRAWVALLLVAIGARPTAAAASEGESLGPVLVAPLQGSEQHRAARGAEVDLALRDSLRARGIAAVEVDPVLGHALVACESRACVVQALGAAGARSSVVPALWARKGGGTELTLTLVRTEGRNLNVSGPVEGAAGPAAARLLDTLLGVGGATAPEVDPAGSAQRRQPNAWKAGPLLLLAGGTAAFVAIGVGAATKGEQQLDTTAVAVWSAVGAAAIAGGVAWRVVGAKRRRAAEVGLGPAKIDLRLRF